MTKPKLTRWYPPDLKPHRSGVYEVDSYSKKFKSYCLFLDGFWHVANIDVHKASKSTHFSIFQARKWRGLTKKP